MAQRKERARIQRGALTAEEAEKLFATVDETGHTNEETARMQRKRRKEVGQAVDVDPLSDADPSGSNVEKVITKTAVSFVVIFLAIVVVSQVSCGLARRASTANLAAATNVTNVASALRGGVEWGNGFTQFPENFTVQEADESTGRVEVSVTEDLRAYRIAEDEPVVKRLRNALAALEMGEPSLVETFGGSDNNQFVKHGLRGVVLASAMELVHTVEEYTLVSEPVKSAALTMKLMTLEDDR